jgi:hypothetical protein
MRLGEDGDFDEIKLYTLKNKAGTTVKISNYGATVTSIVMADRTEQNDLAKMQPEQVQRLEQLWREWAVRTHVFPTPKLRKIAKRNTSHPLPRIAAPLQPRSG